jgi:hypothetical protein
MTLRAPVLGLCVALFAPMAEAGLLRSGDNLPKPVSVMHQMGNDYSRKAGPHIRKTLKKDEPGWGAQWKQIFHQPPMRPRKPYLR